MSHLRASFQSIVNARRELSGLQAALVAGVVALVAATSWNLYSQSSAASAIICAADGSGLPEKLINDAMDWLASEGAFLRALEVLARSHSLPSPESVLQLKEAIRLEPLRNAEQHASVRLSYRGKEVLGPELVHELSQQYAATASQRLAKNCATQAQALRSGLNAARDQLAHLMRQSDQLAVRITHLQQQLRDTRVAQRRGDQDPAVAAARSRTCQSIAEQLTQLLENQNYVLHQIGIATTQAEQAARALAELDAEREAVANLRLAARSERLPIAAHVALVAFAAVVLAVVAFASSVRPSVDGDEIDASHAPADSVRELGLPVVFFAPRANCAA